MGDVGIIPPDSVFITVNRTAPLISPGDSPEFYDESEDFIEAFGGSFIITMASILIIIIVTIIIYVYYSNRVGNCCSRGFE